MPSGWKILAGAADALVAPGFGAPGYRLRRRLWDDPDLELDLAGRVFLVTGANAGIGRAAATALAARRATVHLVARSPERGAEARAAIAAATGNDEIHLHLADLSRLGEVRALGERLARELPALHGLGHNAGVLLDHRALTPEGLETTFATHVAAPLLLTRLLLPRLAASAPARVVFVSSGGMYSQRLDLETLRHGAEPFDGVVAYAQAKRAQVLLARRLDERLGEQGVSVASMHPGWADTGGVRRALPRFHRLTRSFLRTPEQGADTLVWLLASPAAAGVGGGFYLNRLRRREHLPLRRTRSSPAEVDALWRLCEEVTQAEPNSAKGRT